MAVPDCDFKKQDMKFLWVNESGKYIMQLLQNDMSLEDLVDSVEEHYSGNRSDIETAVKSFTDQLREIRFLS